MGISSVFARVNPVFKNVTVEQTSAIIQENLSNSEFVTIDVRTPEEYQQGHIKDSALIDIMSSSFIDKIKGLDRENHYLVYCRSGNRSRRAM
ncbi:rhodanese-like domain-containing protein [bacterium]|nr:rhodanese-like domain-containing protein [bacterium]